jgi:hypothetical protein
MLTFVTVHSPNDGVNDVIFGEDLFWPDRLDVRPSTPNTFGAVNAFSSLGIRISFLDEMVQEGMKC